MGSTFPKILGMCNVYGQTQAFKIVKKILKNFQFKSSNIGIENWAILGCFFKAEQNSFIAIHMRIFELIPPEYLKKRIFADPTRE